MEKNNLNKNWIEWFIGFCDADANFQVFPKVRKSERGVYYNIGYGFHISLSNKDLDLLIDIQNKLKRGKIYEYPEKEEARLAITKLEELKWLIENIFEKAPLLTYHQKERYLRLKHGVLTKFNRVESLEEYNNFIKKSFNFSSFLINKDTTPADMLKSLYKDTNSETAFDNWILGFINGEGYFYARTVYPHRAPNLQARGYSLKGETTKRLEFSIEHTDRWALELIKYRLSISSNVVNRAKRLIGSGGHRKDTYILYISSKENISSLIKLCSNSLFNKLEGNKLKQFSDWMSLGFRSV